MAHPEFQINSKMLKTSLQINEETNELQHVSFPLVYGARCENIFFGLLICVNTFCKMHKNNQNLGRCT